jgi:hypothetical protein
MRAGGAVVGITSALTLGACTLVALEPQFLREAAFSVASRGTSTTVSDPLPSIGDEVHFPMVDARGVARGANAGNEIVIFMPSCDSCYVKSLDLDVLIHTASQSGATVVIQDDLKEFESHLQKSDFESLRVLDKNSEIDFAGYPRPTGLVAVRLVENRVSKYASTQEEVIRLCLESD